MKSFIDILPDHIVELLERDPDAIDYRFERKTNSGLLAITIPLPAHPRQRSFFFAPLEFAFGYESQPRKRNKRQSRKQSKVAEHAVLSSHEMLCEKLMVILEGPNWHASI